MISLIENQLDLGDVKLQTERFFAVEIINPEEKIAVVQVKPSCASCTFLKSGPDAIPKMGQGFYTFIYRPDTLGQMIRSIQFLVNDKIEATLTFKANVV